MAGEVLRDAAEIVFQPEAHREPGGVGREAEHIEAHASGKFWRRFHEWTAGAYFFQDRPNLARLDLLLAAEQDAEQRLRFLRHLGRGGIGPEHRGGITDLDE